ncbi:MAG: phosphatase PAP2 family protein [Bacteroidota bacterium]
MKLKSMKQTFNNIIRQNQIFFVPILLFYLFAVYRIVFYSKIDNHLFFNQLVGNYYVDWFFKYLTYFGDGWVVVLVGILWLFKNIRQGLILLLSYGIAGGLVAILKNYIFDVSRPHFVFDYFYKDIQVKYVDGVDLLALNSFPSGHSTSALVLFTFIALHLNNNIYKLIMAIAGLLVAFSRVYLSQHWLNDIVAGSCIGIILTLLIYTLFEKFQWLNKYDRSIGSGK